MKASRVATFTGIGISLVAVTVLVSFGVFSGSDHNEPQPVSFQDHVLLQQFVIYCKQFEKSY